MIIKIITRKKVRIITSSELVRFSLYSQTLPCCGWLWVLLIEFSLQMSRVQRTLSTSMASATGTNLTEKSWQQLSTHSLYYVAGRNGVPEGCNDEFRNREPRPVNCRVYSEYLVPSMVTAIELSQSNYSKKLHTGLNISVWVLHMQAATLANPKQPAGD